MDNKVRKLVTGYCPHMQQNTHIFIDYEKINVIGDSKTYLKAIGLVCDYIDDCHSLDEYGRCPIFIANEDK